MWNVGVVSVYHMQKKKKQPLTHEDEPQVL